MRTAEESRNISNEFLKRKLDKSLEEISKMIDKSIHLGEFHINYYDTISNEVIVKLRDLGYNIDDCSSQKDGYCYRISWY